MFNSVGSFPEGQVPISRGSAGTSPGGGCLERSACQWHTARTLESGSVILEMKDGACKPIGEEVYYGPMTESGV